jgi:VCBS repeat-containing protein
MVVSDAEPNENDHVYLVVNGNTYLIAKVVGANGETGTESFVLPPEVVDQLRVGGNDFQVYSTAANQERNNDDFKVLSAEIVSSVSNSAPVANDDSAMLSEDGSTVVAVLANDTDANSDPLTVTNVDGATHGEVVLNANGTVTYTPNANYNGSDSFTYTVSDGKGATDTATVTVTVTGVNDAPVAADDTGSSNEDTTITGSVAANDTDVDTGVLSYAVNGTAPAGFTLNPNGSWSLNASNAAYQDLAAGATRDVVVSYTVSDGLGGSDTGELTVTVTGVNDAPVAADDSFGSGTSKVYEGMEYVIDVTDLLSNDGDVDGTFQFAGTASNPTKGMVAVVQEGGSTFLVYTYNLHGHRLTRRCNCNRLVQVHCFGWAGRHRYGDCQSDGDGSCEQDDDGHQLH